MISHDPWDVTHKEAIMRKWVYSPKEAIAECNRLAEAADMAKQKPVKGSTEGGRK